MGVENFETTIKVAGTEIKLRGTTSTGLKGFIEVVAPWQELPSVCKNCSGTSLKFVHRVVKSYVYYSVDCANPKCMWTFKMGQLKDGSGLYNKGDKSWEPPYSGNGNNGGYEQADPYGNSYTGQSSAAPQGYEEDIDFNYGSNAPGQPAVAHATTRPVAQPQHQNQNAGTARKQLTPEEIAAHKAALGMA